MAVALPDDLQSLLRGALVPMASPAGMQMFFPTVYATIPQGESRAVAVGLALREAARRQVPGALDGPLITLGRELEHVASSAGTTLLDWLANTGPGAKGGNPYAAFRVGGYRRPFVDHTRFRKHLKEALEGPRTAVWVPPPLGVDRRSLHELTLDIGALRGQRVGSAEWVPSTDMTMESVARKVVGAFSYEDPGPSMTTPAARADYLAAWLWQEACKSGHEVSFVFSGFRTPDADDILLMVLGLMERVRDSVGPNRVRVILLDCEFAPSFDSRSQGFKKTQESQIDPATLRQEIVALLEATNALEPGAAEELVESIWTDPPNIPRLHEALEELLEAIDDQ